MRVLTALVKTMDRGDLVDRHGANLQSKAWIFDTLFKTTTQRIVTNHEFAIMAGELWASADADEKRQFVESKSREIVGSSWWYEPDPEFALWSAHLGEGIVIYRVQKKNRADKGVFVEPLINIMDGDRERSQRTLTGFLLNFLFALEKMPPRFTERAETPFAIPKALRDKEAKFQLFNSVYLRGYQKTAGGDHSVLDISGRRWHFVRAHWMTPQGAEKPVWRKSHWRGDPTLGVVRKVFVAKEEPKQ